MSLAYWCIDLCLSSCENFVEFALKYAETMLIMVCLQFCPQNLRNSLNYPTILIRKPSETTLRCRIIETMVDFAFDSALFCALVKWVSQKYWLGRSQVWNKTRNYSMKLSLNVTLFLTWAGEHYNWFAHRIISPSNRLQVATIQHQKCPPSRAKRLKEKFHSEKVFFNDEWKHGARIHMQKA